VGKEWLELIGEEAKGLEVEENIYRIPNDYTPVVTLRVRSEVFCRI